MIEYWYCKDTLYEEISEKLEIIFNKERYYKYYIEKTTLIDNFNREHIISRLWYKYFYNNIELRKFKINKLI